MEENLLATMDLVAPRLPAEWVGPAALARVRVLCAHLPPSPCFGLECRLDPRDGQVDLVTLVDGDTLGAMARAHDWTRLSSFLALRDQISEWPPLVVAEFDLVANGPAVPPPALFLPDLVRPGDITRLAPVLKWWETVSGISGHGWAERLASALPDGAEGGVGLYFSRPLQSLRYCMQGLKPSGWFHLLAGLGGHPAAPALERLVKGLGPLADQFSFTLDAGRAPGPDLGVELHLLRVPRIEPRWDGLVRELERMGIDSEMLEPVRSWAGSVALNPEPLSDLVEELLEGPRLRHLYWRVSHLKLILRDGEPPRAKVYLMVRQLENSARKLRVANVAATAR